MEAVWISGYEVYKKKSKSRNHDQIVQERYIHEKYYKLHSKFSTNARIYCLACALAWLLLHQRLEMASMLSLDTEKGEMPAFCRIALNIHIHVVYCSLEWASRTNVCSAVKSANEKGREWRSSSGTIAHLQSWGMYPLGLASPGLE